MTGEKPETTVKNRDSLAGRMTPPNLPKPNASPASGTKRTRVSRKPLGEDVIGYAHAIKVEALAGLGDLLKQTPKATGGDRAGRKSKLGGSRENPPNMPPTLAEMGIDKKTANLARKLAALSDAERNAIASRDKTLADVTRPAR